MHIFIELKFLIGFSFNVIRRIVIKVWQFTLIVHLVMTLESSICCLKYFENILGKFIFTAICTLKIKQITVLWYIIQNFIDILTRILYYREMGGLLIIIAWTSIARFTTVGRYLVNDETSAVESSKILRYCSVLMHDKTRLSYQW